MEQAKLKQLILEVLKSDERLWNEDKTELNQTLLLDLVEKIDEKVIDLLLQEKDLREKFFVKIKDVYVFKTNDFRFFMEENKVDNSYTAYKNRIGLTDGKRFLKDTNDVVLNWPYKDCVLEGGQSTEEGTDTYFEYDEKTDKYEQKQAKRKEIFFNEVLAHDEIDRLFDAKALTNWKRYTKDGEQEVKEIKRDEDGTIKENMIIKGNNLLALHSLKKQFAGKVKLIYIDPPYNTGSDSFKYNDNFPRSTWLTFMKNRLIIAKDLLSQNGFILIQIDHNQGHYLKVLMDEVFGEKNFRNEIIWGYRTGGIPEKGKLPKKHDNLFLYSNSDISTFDLFKERQYLEKDFMGSSIDNEGRYYVDTNLRDVIEGIIKISEDGVIKEYNTRPVLNVSSENIDGFRSQKPEGLIHLFLDIFTQENDIILDFFAGTGTTFRVAHKLKRQYLGIEQMESTMKEKLIPNLINVIKGSQTGISKSVNWQGGGDFIYFELAKWNETAKEKILACESLEELIKFFDEMYERYFLNYNLKIKEFREKVINEEEFKNLSLDGQKKIFIAMLDNNQMYVNKTEMADKKFGINKKDQELTELFYNEGR